MIRDMIRDVISVISDTIRDIIRIISDVISDAIRTRCRSALATPHNVTECRLSRSSPFSVFFLA